MSSNERQRRKDSPAADEELGEFYTPAEVAQMLRRTASYVRNEINEGRLEARRVRPVDPNAEPRLLLIHSSAVKRYWSEYWLPVVDDAS